MKEVRKAKSGNNSALSFLKVSLAFVLLIFYSSVSLFAQSENEQPVKLESELLEDIAENADVGIDASMLTEELQYLIAHPIDINSASAADFEKLGVLTPFQISSIIEYRKEHGKFLSVNELNGVDGFSVSTLKLILPFIKIGETQGVVKKEFSQLFLANIGRRIEKQSGYENVSDSIKAAHPNSYYLGNPYLVRLKYKGEFGNAFDAGFTAEKDPGETWFSGNNKTFDFLSGYLQFQDKGILKNIIVGDFNACFGQGLVIWNGFSSGKTSFANNICKSNEGFNHYSSTNENQFFRGIASKIQYKQLTFSTFISSKHIDANVLNNDSAGNATIVSSFENCGIHALPSQIADEDKLGEKTFGGNLSYDFGIMRIGSTLSNTLYSAAVQKQDVAYNYYAFSGKRIGSAGLNYLVRGRRFNIFGEFALNSTNGNAFINGASLQIVPELSISILQRYFSPQYYMPYARAFSQCGIPTNEQGVYIGVEFSPVSKFKLTAYSDFFKSPWLKYRISAPSAGLNYFINGLYDISKNSSVSIRYIYLQNEEDISSSTPNPNEVVKVSLHKVRINADFALSNRISTGNRVECVLYTKQTLPNQKGFMFYQDFMWKPVKNLVLTARYMVFNTDGWESRIYAYENDVLYSNSMPAISGKGARTYLLLKYKAGRYLNLWLKYCISTYFDRNTIGTGVTEIQGNQKSDINFEATFNL